MMTGAAVDQLTQRTVRALRKLSPSQRNTVLIRILECDPDLATVLPALRATIAAAYRIRLPIRRDGVS
jgi:hypothetical protein